jgi:hypothetical protein
MNSINPTLHCSNIGFNCIREIGTGKTPVKTPGVFYFNTQKFFLTLTFYFSFLLAHFGGCKILGRIPFSKIEVLSHLLAFNQLNSSL